VVRRWCPKLAVDVRRWPRALHTPPDPVEIDVLPQVGGSTSASSQSRRPEHTTEETPQLIVGNWRQFDGNGARSAEARGKRRLPRGSRSCARFSANCSTSEQGVPKTTPLELRNAATVHNARNLYPVG
jgi:hypothetical protein